LLRDTFTFHRITTLWPLTRGRGEETTLLDPDQPDWIFRQQSHVGIVCEDLDRTIAEYGQLGYTFAVRQGEITLRRPGLGPQDPFSVRSAWSLQGPPHIELGEVADAGSEPYLWPSRGHDHVEHYGFWVDDLVAASALLEERGFPLEITPAGDDTKPLGFCYHRTPSGARIELEDGPTRRPMLEAQFARVRSGDTSPTVYTPVAPR
jgi:catechol 2,3-dioxygenase-like lactoylglutathione lyase family enzyme